MEGNKKNPANSRSHCTVGARDRVPSDIVAAGDQRGEDGGGDEAARRALAGADGERTQAAWQGYESL